MKTMIPCMLYWIKSTENMCCLKAHSMLGSTELSIKNTRLKYSPLLKTGFQRTRFFIKFKDQQHKDVYHSADQIFNARKSTDNHSVQNVSINSESGSQTITAVSKSPTKKEI